MNPLLRLLLALLPVDADLLTNPDGFTLEVQTLWDTLYGEAS